MATPWDNLVFFAGRRGEIQWEKPNIAGAGGSRDFDTYRAVGFVFPLVLLQSLHTFNWSGFSNAGNAIPLNPKRGFRARAYLHDWCALFSIGGLFAVTILGCMAWVWRLQEKPQWTLCLAGAVASGMLWVASIWGWVRMTRHDRRDRDIRLLLGRHSWGSSDPAYWHPDLLTDVRQPAETHGAPTFAELARRHLAAREWSPAMWSARLCAALEDWHAGEELTSRILGEAEVKEKLKGVRKEPHCRDAVLGAAPPFGTWVRGDLEQRVLRVMA